MWTLASVVASSLLLGACDPRGASPPPASVQATAEETPSLTLPPPSPGSSGVTPLPSVFSGPGRIVYTQFQFATGTYTALTINPDGSGIAAVGANGTALSVRSRAGAAAVARWSPDGRQIGVTNSSANGVFETIVSADGTASRDLVLADPTLRLRCLAWSPDGQRLLCQGSDPTRPGRHGLYTVRSSDGGDLQRLTSEDGIPGDYSPDGTTIAFVTRPFAPTANGQLWVCDADGTNPRKITDTLTGYDVSWSPDGGLIAGDANGKLLIFDFSDLTRPAREIAIPNGSATQPRWSPDGRKLVFQFVATGGTVPDIYVVDLDGSGARQLTTSQKPDDSPDWGRAQ